MFIKGDKVETPSGLGGKWDCIVKEVSAAGVVYMTIDNTQYPDAHGQEITAQHYNVKKRN